MMSNARKLILAGVSAVIIVIAVISLLHPAPLARFLPTRVNRAKSGSLTPSSNNPTTLPGVNAAAFKGQGRLAFVWQGMLYVLDGATGDVSALSTPIMAMSPLQAWSQQAAPGGVSQPVWSHDGEWLSLVQVGTGQVWLANRDGTSAEQVPAPDPVAQFSWSPTADTLAVGGTDGLELVPAGGESHRLLDVQVQSLCWSPDGKSLAYSATLGNNPGGSDALYTIAIDGGQVKEQMVAAPMNGMIIAGWWPDGKGLLYWLDPSFSASIKADGLALWSLRLGDSQPKLLANSLTYPEWLSMSPQGDLLMVAGGGREVWANKNLAIVNVESGSIRNLKNPKGSVSIDPSLSPDGSRIAFVAAKNLGTDVGGFNKPEDLTAWVTSRSLWIENVDGSGAHRLTSAGQGVYQPLWSKDRSHILYLKDNSLWLIGADGGEPEKICGPFSYEDPVAGAFGYYGFISYHDQVAWFQS
jgi:hypothetical protein